MSSKKDKTTGRIEIPSSLDKTATAIIAATIESVDRVGPCSSKMTIESIQDIREAKKAKIINRAKKILQKWTLEDTPSSDEVVKEVSDSLRTAEISEYGTEKLPAGPDVETSNSIIIVEGRADVINLLKAGIDNPVAVEGAKIPEDIIKLSKDRETTAFLDGDRGGDLILKELLQVAELDFVARAPRGREVEELSPKEIFKSLRSKKPIEAPREAKRAKPTPKKEEAKKRTKYPKAVLETVEKLRGTLEAIALNKEMKELARIPVSKIAEELKEMNKVHTLVFDGVITQRLVDIASEKKVKTLIADRISDVAKQPVDLELLTFKEMKEGKSQ